MRWFLTPTAQVGGKRLTRKRRRASRSRRWGTGSGRRLPSGGPSSPVRRSRTCSYPGASPIFAPFVWSLPPTCCPLLRSVSFLVLVSVVILKTHTKTTPSTFTNSARIFLKKTNAQSMCRTSGNKKALTQDYWICQTKVTASKHVLFTFFKASQSHHRFLIHSFPSSPQHDIPTLFRQSQSSPLRNTLVKLGEDFSQTLVADVSQLRPEDPAVVVASGERTLTDWHSYHLEKSENDRTAVRLRVRRDPTATALFQSGCLH